MKPTTASVERDGAEAVFAGSGCRVHVAKGVKAACVHFRANGVCLEGEAEIVGQHAFQPRSIRLRIARHHIQVLSQMGIQTRMVEMTIHIRAEVQPDMR